MMLLILATVSFAQAAGIQLVEPPLRQALDADYLDVWLARHTCWIAFWLYSAKAACSLDAVCSNQAVHIAARYYVTMDILRRVLESHFHYHIMFVMNVTDIDDKIIKRARLKHLLSQHLQQTPDDSKASVRVPVDACWAGSWGWRVMMSPSWYDVLQLPTQHSN